MNNSEFLRDQIGKLEQLKENETDTTCPESLGRFSEISVAMIGDIRFLIDHTKPDTQKEKEDLEEIKILFESILNPVEQAQSTQYSGA